LNGFVHSSKSTAWFELIFGYVVHHA